MSLAVALRHEVKSDRERGEPISTLAFAPLSRREQVLTLGLNLARCSGAVRLGRGGSSRCLSGSGRASTSEEHARHAVSDSGSDGDSGGGLHDLKLPQDRRRVSSFAR